MTDDKPPSKKFTTLNKDEGFSALRNLLAAEVINLDEHRPRKQNLSLGSNKTK